MPFAGTAVIKQVSDRLIRVTGLSVPAGSAGAFALHGFVPTQAVAPSLGTAERYGVLTPIYVNTNAAAGSQITGNLGYVTPPSELPNVSGATHVDDAAYTQALADMATARTALQALTPTFSFAAGAVNLGTDTTHGTAGTYTPGVYVVTGAASTSAAATIHLSGPGLYVFRISGTLTTAATTTINCTNGADPANVFWVVGGNVSIGSANSVVGTFMPASSATFSIVGADNTHLSSLTGRALGFSTTTTTRATPIAVPLSVGDPVELPAAFSPQTFSYQGDVTLQDSIRVDAMDTAAANSVATAIAVVKSGTSAADFLATIYNTGVTQDSPNQEFYIRFHD